MSDLVIVREKPVIVTPVSEWIGIAIVITAAIVVVILIYYLLKPRLFSGTDYKGAQPPDQGVTCPTSPAPTGLTGTVVDHSRPSFDASGGAVLTPTTGGASRIGYNVSVSETPGLSSSHTVLAGFAPSPQIRITPTGNASLQYGKIYYYRVATVDTCGPGALSTEEFSIAI